SVKAIVDIDGPAPALGGAHSAARRTAGTRIQPCPSVGFTGLRWLGTLPAGSSGGAAQRRTARRNNAHGRTEATRGVIASDPLAHARSALFGTAFRAWHASPPCGACHPAPRGRSTGPLGPVTISVLPMRPNARGGLDRAAWLAERRAAVIAAYDAGAPDYNEHEYPSDMQREWVIRLLRRLPPNSTVLDAPCGTGKYFPLVAAAGHQVAGID